MIRRYGLAAIGVFGLASAAAAQPAPSAVQRPPEAVYAKTCGYCHGVNVGPVIRGRGLDAEAIRYIVRHGQNAMPAFRPTEITEAELAALAGWIAVSKADPREHGQ